MNSIEKDELKKSNIEEAIFSEVENKGEDNEQILMIIKKGGKEEAINVEVKIEELKNPIKLANFLRDLYEGMQLQVQLEVFMRQVIKVIPDFIEKYQTKKEIQDLMNKELKTKIS